MPVSTPPTFKPQLAPLQLAAGVLTCAGGAGPLSWAASGGAGLPNRYTFSAAAGANNDIVPAGAPAFPGTVACRVIMTAAAGNANITGMLAGVDGQLAYLFNNDAANSITFNNLNVGSAAADQITGRAGADALLPPKTGLIMVYDSTLVLWIML